MKTLYLIRHAKTDQPLEDKDRQLLESGIERTRQLGKYLQQQNCKIDTFYSSIAKRAVQTAHLIAQEIHFPADKIITLNDLYTGSSDTYYHLISAQDNALHSVLFVGHNPEISDVVRFFVPDMTSYMQTGACYCIDFETDKWENIFIAPRKIRFYVRPR